VILGRDRRTPPGRTARPPRRSRRTAGADHAPAPVHHGLPPGPRRPSAQQIGPPYSPGPSRYCRSVSGPQDAVPRPRWRRIDVHDDLGARGELVGVRRGGRGPARGSGRDSLAGLVEVHPQRRLPPGRRGPQPVVSSPPIANQRTPSRPPLSCGRR
jgi:hypothetical protein